ncbi:zinc finger protein [Trichonephila clavipes]|nr:zinc finger protein [Trichonephila clavipes]
MNRLTPGHRFQIVQNEIAVVPDFHKRISFSDEAHFWLNGYVNKQNCRIWSEANPQVYVETPLHPEKTDCLSLVYADKPQTLDRLEDNISRVIADIRPQMLEKVIENWTSRLDYIRASRGSHMPEVTFKIICKKRTRDFLIITIEISVFKGILLLTGYHSHTYERDYWSDDEDLGITLVKNGMSRNRFQKLKSYLHFVDNGTVGQHDQDRFFKVKPLFIILNSHFMKFGGEVGQIKVALRTEFQVTKKHDKDKDIAGQLA